MSPALLEAWRLLGIEPSDQTLEGLTLRLLWAELDLLSETGRTKEDGEQEARLRAACATLRGEESG